jgi:hypothetical protein
MIDKQSICSGGWHCFDSIKFGQTAIPGRFGGNYPLPFGLIARCIEQPQAIVTGRFGFTGTLYISLSDNMGFLFQLKQVGAGWEIPNNPLRNGGGIAFIDGCGQIGGYHAQDQAQDQNSQG